MLRTYIAVLALAGIGLAATGSGCGKAAKSAGVTETTASTIANSAESAPRGPVLSRRALISKADAICFGINARRSSTKLSVREDYVQLVPPLAAYETTALVKLNKLVPPAAMAGDWNQILADARALIEATAAVGREFTNNEVPQAEASILVAETAGQKMVAVARRDGFKDCAS